ncbi:MAG: DUF5930 domain-containing protein, partial [Rubricella sp.]
MLNRLNRALSYVFPERRLYIRTGSVMRYRQVSPLTQAFGVLCISAFGLVGTASTVAVIVQMAQPPLQGDAVSAVQAAYEQRIEMLVAEREAEYAARADAEARAEQAREALFARHEMMLDLATDLESAIAAADRARMLEESARAELAKLESVIADQETLIAELGADLAERDALEYQLAMSLDTLSSGLEENAALVAALSAENERLATNAAQAAAEVTLLRQQQTRVYERMEVAVDAGLEALEGVFRRSGTDVEALINTVRADFVGQGGPEIPLPGDDQSMLLDFDRTEFAAPVADTERTETLFARMERLDRLRIVAERLPFARPVTAPHRQTSGFGPRRDPFTRRSRMHSGTDFAAPRGTPILAGGSGEVVHAGPLG